MPRNVWIIQTTKLLREVTVLIILSLTLLRIHPPCWNGWNYRWRSTKQISLIEHDDNIMRKILDIVTKELVLRLTADPQFTEQIAKQITETGIVNEMMKLPSPARRAGNSRWHCCRRAGGLRTQLERQVVKLPRNAIDRSHRLGRATGGISGGGKPRPIILKFVSYQDRSAVFARKKQLKGTKIVITENLTKRRAELLAKARATASVKATWTADGRDRLSAWRRAKGRSRHWERPARSYRLNVSYSHPFDYYNV